MQNNIIAMLMDALIVAQIATRDNMNERISGLTKGEKLIIAFSLFRCVLNNYRNVIFYLPLHQSIL